MVFQIEAIAMNEFGFTNDSREYERVCAWRDAAIADGWDHRPLYPNK